MALRLILLLIISIGSASLVLGQDSVRHWQDSLKLSVGTMATVASKDFLPFWLVANKYGTIKDRKEDLSTNVYIHNEHSFFKDRLKLSYTMDLYSHNHFGDFTLVEGNVKLNYKGWAIRGGRYREIIGEVDPAFSTGSLGLSGNALPIPKIGIAVSEYKKIPFTKGWLQFKGLFSHGWMGHDRYYESYLHEKAFYLRAGRGKLKLFGGVVHFGEWGGRRGDFSLNRSLKGFLDVLFAKEANDGSLPVNSPFRPNRAGDQRGALEYGIDWESKYGYWHFYNQTPFESGTGIDIRNVDRLAGISLTWKNGNNLFKKILLEFIYTKQMESYGKESQSYYNNGFYKTGWEYRDYVIGNPLFINRKRASNFFAIRPFDWQINEAVDGVISGHANIVTNRMMGGNIGVQYSPFSNVLFKTQIALVVYFMDRTAIARIANNKYTQSYLSQELETKLNNKLVLKGQIAIDIGGFYNNIGGNLGINYKIL